MKDVLFAEPDKPNIYLFNCPGCGGMHWFQTNRHVHPAWEWNGDMKKPTISPSILNQYPRNKTPYVCHIYIRDGQIQFLSDCTHELAGQTVPMIPIDED